jgi:hypothetical protein
MNENFQENLRACIHGVYATTAWFSFLDRATAEYQYSKKENVFAWLIVGITERSPL